DDESHHGASPWCLPFGSGNPDRHGYIIAERRTWRACRGGAAPAFCSALLQQADTGIRPRVELGRTRESLEGCAADISVRSAEGQKRQCSRQAEHLRLASESGYRFLVSAP